MDLINDSGGPTTLTLVAVVIAILSSSWLFGAFITFLTKGKNPLVMRKKSNDDA